MKSNPKSLLYFFLILSIVLSMLTIMATAEAKPSGLSARCAVLYEPSGKTFLYEKNADTALPMASITKIMTAIIVIERGGLEEYVTVPSDAVGIEGSSIYLAAGDRLRIKDLVYSLMLRSANDAAACLAITTAGNIESFATLMNEKATRVGMTSTSFTNPHGLDDPMHYTTARDMALLTAYCLENPIFCEIVSTYKYSFTIDEEIRTVINHNKLLSMYDGAIGVKTGYTKKSGRCLVGAARKDGLSLITVTLDAPSDWSDHRLLFDYGFGLVKKVEPSELSKTEFTLPVIGGSESEIKCQLENTEAIIIGKNDVITARVRIDKYIIAPASQGKIVGAIDYYINGELYCTRQIVAEKSVKAAKSGFFTKR